MALGILWFLLRAIFMEEAKMIYNYKSTLLNEKEYSSFAKKLYAKSAHFTEKEFEIVLEIDRIHNEREFRPYFEKEDVIQHALCLFLIDHKISKLSSFSALLRRELRREKRGIHFTKMKKGNVDKCPEIAANEDNDIILNDIIRKVKEYDIVIGEVLDLYRYGFTFANIAKDLFEKYGAYNNKGSVSKLYKKGIKYAVTI